MPLGEVVERSISNRPLDKRFMQDALTPNLSCQRKPLIHELKNVAQECRRARKRLRRMSKQLGSLDAASPSFHHEILRRMKEFVVLIGEERRALNLCTPLCSRSSLTLMGRLGDATLFADGSTESAQALLNRLLDFLSDMDRALKLNADSIGSAAKKL